MRRRSKDLEEEHRKQRGQLAARALRLEQARPACQGAAGMGSGERGRRRLPKARTTHGSITQTKGLSNTQVDANPIPEYFITLFQCSRNTTPEYSGRTVSVAMGQVQ